MEERMQAFLNYIDHHVMHHGGSLDALTHKNWLSTLGHDILTIFHFDVTMLVLIVLIALLVVLFGRKKIGVSPRGFGVLLEKYVLFIRDEIVYPNFGGAEHGRGFVPFFCTVFFFIFTANFLGLIPLFTTATGNISVTAGLSLIFFGVSLYAVFRKGLGNAFHAMVPGGLPVPMRPMMFVMEWVSLFARTFALAVRLFANMLGGHVVLYSMISLSAILGVAATPSLAVAIGLYLFEAFVACLQAYVFTVLSAIFIGMMVHPQH
ncbi:MAG: F0F1 ATP synthase subunit A [bacterium]|nr:F0F1 ATP synthase subunit A [bacterium]